MNCKEFVKSESLVNIFEICQTEYFLCEIREMVLFKHKKAVLHNIVCTALLEIYFLCKGL